MRSVAASDAKHGTAAGFTLLELLVSATVLSLLAASMLFGWRVAASAWSKSSQVLEQQRRVAATLQLMEKQMAQMVPQAVWTRQGSSAVFFQGEARTARFLTRYSLQERSGSGLYLVEYHIQDAQDGTRQLLMNERPIGNTDDAGVLRTGEEQRQEGNFSRFASFERTARTRVLLDGLTRARMEYFRPERLSQPGSWVERWHIADELPRAMAVRVEIEARPNELRPVTMVAEIRNFTRRQPQ